MQERKSLELDFYDIQKSKSEQTRNDAAQEEVKSRGPDVWHGNE